MIKRSSLAFVVDYGAGRMAAGFFFAVAGEAERVVIGEIAYVCVTGVGTWRVTGVCLYQTYTGEDCRAADMPQ